MSDDDKPKQIGYSEDESYGDYEWKFSVVYSHKGRFYIIQDRGCSCNEPASSYGEDSAIVGPAATLGGLFDELNVDKDKHTDDTRAAFINALETLNAETITAAKAALGLK